MQRPWTRVGRVVAAFSAAMLGGCVERTLQIDSEPSEALVFLNGEEAGRTSMRRNFVYYGTYDVQLRKEGYRTLSARARVWAPLWQIPPFDLLAELAPFPLTDTHRVKYTMQPITEEQTDPEAMIGRAVRLRGRLESSAHTKKPGAAEDGSGTEGGTGANEARSADARSADADGEIVPHTADEATPTPPR